MVSVGGGSLEEAGRLYPKAARRLLTLTQDAMPADVPAGVVVQPACEWMLATPGGERRSARRGEGSGWPRPRCCGRVVTRRDH